MRIIGLGALAALALAGCATSVSVIENKDGIQFAESKDNFIFYNKAFPSGEKFQIVDLSDGRKAVWIDRITATTLGGISARNRGGFILNRNLCSTGEELVYSIGMVNYGPPREQFKNICFTVD